jgi:hypothetical protein
VVRVPRWQMSQPEQRTLNSQSPKPRNVSVHGPRTAIWICRTFAALSMPCRPNSGKHVCSSQLLAGFSYEEAAAIVGCAIGTIISRAHRARWKLMEMLEMNAPRKLDPIMPSAVNLWRRDEEELGSRNPGPIRLIEA